VWVGSDLEILQFIVKGVGRVGSDLEIIKKFTQKNSLATKIHQTGKNSEFWKLTFNNLMIVDNNRLTILIMSKMISNKVACKLHF